MSKAQTSQRSLFLHPLPSPVIPFTLHGALLPLSIACPSLSRSPSQTANTRTPLSLPFGFPFPSPQAHTSPRSAPLSHVNNVDTRSCLTDLSTLREKSTASTTLTQPNLHWYTHTHTAGRTRRVGRTPRPASVSLSVTPSRPVIQCDDATTIIRTRHDDATSTLALAAAAAHRSHLGAVQPRARRDRCRSLCDAAPERSSPFAAALCPFLVQT